MYINKLFLKEFGKFNNRERKLEQGLNVLYGDEGAGKSTVRDFVTGILFGINKSRGLGSGRMIILPESRRVEMDMLEKPM